MVELELTYLYEVGRVSEPATAPLSALRKTMDQQPHSVAATSEGAGKV